MSMIEVTILILLISVIPLMLYLFSLSCRIDSIELDVENLKRWRDK